MNEPRIRILYFTREGYAWTGCQSTREHALLLLSELTEHAATTETIRTRGRVTYSDADTGMEVSIYAELRD